MKIYIATSWKMEQSAKDLAVLLRSWGYEVDCFCDVSTGRFVFSFKEIKNYEKLNAITFLKDNHAKRAFKISKSRF